MDELVNASKDLTVVLVDKKAKPGTSEVVVALIVVKLVVVELVTATPTEDVKEWLEWSTQVVSPLLTSWSAQARI